MESKIEKIKNSLVLQYAKLEGKTEGQIKLKLENLDWQKEFKKLERQLKIYKIGYAVLLIIIMGLIVLALFNSKIMFNAFSFAGSIGGLIGVLKVAHNLSDRIRVLGLLHEIYV